MGTTIKRIYTGLPEHLVKEVLWVERNYRINELSHQPGGFDIVIEYKSGNVLGYDWIKRPSHYIEKILQTEYIQEEKGFHQLTDDEQNALALKYIRAAYARNYKDKKNYDSAVFKQVWNSSMSFNTIVKALCAFEEDTVPFKNRLTVAEKFMKHSKISNIKQLNYFSLETGIVSKSFTKPFEVSGSLELGEMFHWDIFSEFPTQILEELWLNKQPDIRISDMSTTLQVTAVIEVFYNKVVLQVNSPSTGIRMVNDIPTIIKLYPTPFTLIVNDNGIHLFSKDKSCITIGGNPDEWVFSD
ncbi:hypothetical protein MON38_09560 [Hymenobacter sp. DH14]|uniref:Uncharacterized protein n=1 Tax=Hymenobacter cyanobacteriorum TaxID=2926463 RepID=A0A9X1VGD9_9BACT|nr:hypothetical protein [Hymenobacter cyanobacteriorum]MCI1187667.1 hypothetical protein [Hymenobacter cyanobacteriorum]